MNEKSRTENTKINIGVNTGIQIMTLIVSFISRTVFIKILGEEYLGISGLFSNILNILSLAELGIGTSVVYALYKPIAENDREKISQLMKFYKTTYRIIALVVLAFGLLFIPFLDFFVKTDEEIPHLTLYYLLYLANSAASYLLIYKSSILNADQRYYVLKINRFVFEMLKHVLQISVMVLTHNFLFYLVVQIICTIGSNLSISRRVDKLYPFLKEHSGKLPGEEKRAILANVKNIFIYKIGGVILNNTDNILISKILGTVIVGYYSNYLLIVNAVTTFTTLIFSSITGSVGNLNASASPKESLRIYNLLHYISFWIHGFCAVAVMSLISDFVALWVGLEFRVDSFAVFAISVNLFLSGTVSINAVYRNTTGLFKDIKYIFVFTSVLNIVLSIVLGMKIGLGGILIATAISRILTTVWFEPYTILKKYFNTGYLSYFLRQIEYTAITVLAYVPIYFLNKMLPQITMVNFMVKVVFTAVIPNLVFLLCTFKTEEFSLLKHRITESFKIKPPQHG